MNRVGFDSMRREFRDDSPGPSTTPPRTWKGLGGTSGEHRAAERREAQEWSRDNIRQMMERMILWHREEVRKIYEKTSSRNLRDYEVVIKGNKEDKDTSLVNVLLHCSSAWAKEVARGRKSRAGDMSGALTGCCDAAARGLVRIWIEEAANSKPVDGGIL